MWYHVVPLVKSPHLGLTTPPVVRRLTSSSVAGLSENAETLKVANGLRSLQLDGQIPNGLRLRRSPRPLRPPLGLPVVGSRWRSKHRDHTD